MEKKGLEMITVYDNIVQGSQEWLDLRKNRITCSNALLLLEKGQQACLAANADAASRITPNGNFYAERGHVLENEVRDAFNAQLKNDNFSLVEAGMLVNSKYPNAGYSPDGLVLSNDAVDTTDFDAIIEIKAYNDIVIRNGEKVLVGKHAKACESYDNVPLGARCQIQMELLISEAPMCYLILTNPDAEAPTPRVKIYEVKPDPVMQKRLIEKLSHE